MMTAPVASCPVEPIKGALLCTARGPSAGLGRLHGIPTSQAGGQRSSAGSASRPAPPSLHRSAARRGAQPCIALRPAVRKVGRAQAAFPGEPQVRAWNDMQ